MPETLPQVLIVDREVDVCVMVRQALSAGGYPCVATEDPARAAALLEDQPFRVMVADASVVEGDGQSLLEHARRVRPECRPILMTSLAGEEGLTQALAHGAYDLIEKPFELADLVQAVARAASAGSPEQYLSLRAAQAIKAEEQFRQASLAGIRALVRAVEAKDPYTRRHSDHVTHYAVALAETLGASDYEIESLRIAAMLHDIGKIGIPDHVLVREGALDPSDRTLIDQHPVVGAEIISNISLLRKEARLIRHHHENWDGTGYPDGLAGEQIPFYARVLRIADALDAMLMARSYHNAATLEWAMDEMVRCRGKQFAPDLVAPMVSWCLGHRNEVAILSPEAPAA